MAEKENVNSNEGKKSVTTMRIAMMDVDRVVSKAASVQELKKEREQKEKELERWLNNARKQIEKPDSKDVKSKLAQRYEKEFQEKKAAVAREFKEKLKSVNENVTRQIITAVKENNYDIVLSKAVVVCGCDDITELIEKAIK